MQQCHLDYSVGFAITGKVHDAIGLIPTHAWTPAIDTDGDPRDGGDVVERPRSPPHGSDAS